LGLPPLGGGVGWGVLFGFLGTIPYIAWKARAGSKLKEISEVQKKNDLADRAFEQMKKFADKSGKELGLTKAEFEKQIASLTDTEKEAFVYLMEGTNKLDITDKNFAMKYAKLNKDMEAKFGKEVTKGLSEKTGNF